MREVLESPTPDTLIDKVDRKAVPHSEDVLIWRELAFLDMRFSSSEAAAMARTRIDLHQMRQLLASGCPHNEARRILLDTCFAGEDDFDYFPLSLVGDGEGDQEDGA